MNTEAQFMASKTQSGLFLDLDGTLADSLGVMRQIYYQFLAEFGRTGSQEEFDRLNGPSLSDVLAVLRRDHNLAPPLEDLLFTYTSFLEKAYREVAPNDGAHKLVQAAVDEGWAVGVVSSNVGKTVAAWLAKVGLAGNVTVVATGDTVAHGKPAPDLYLKALRDSGCDAAVSYAVEDTLTGVRSAVGAGLSTFALVPEGSPEVEWPAGVRIITNLEHLIPLAQWTGGGVVPDV
jgi:HAD superfamily hydrolase (TIGR01509 family)